MAHDGRAIGWLAGSRGTCAMISSPLSADTAPATSNAGHTNSGLSILRLLPLAAVALLCGLGATLWISRAGEVRLIGFLHAEQSVVYAPHSGRVEAVQARTGELVKPRQPLIQLTDDTLNHEISAKTREVTSLQAALEQCRAKAEVQMSLQRKNVDEELLRTKLESAKFLREHYAANFEHVSLRHFAKQGNTGQWLAATPDFLSQPERIFNSAPTAPIVTPDEMKFTAVMRQELARNLAESNKVNSELCDQHIDKLEKLRESLPDMIRKAAGVDVAEAKLAQAAEQLSALNQQKAAMSVVSPGHGIVGAYAKHAADPVGVGEALVTIHDRERPFVEVDVPSREVIRLHVGQTLLLDFAGEFRTGRVEFICPQAHNRNGDSDSYITVRVNPAGKLWPEVAIGSAVSVRMK